MANSEGVARVTTGSTGSFLERRTAALRRQLQSEPRQLSAVLLEFGLDAPGLFAAAGWELTVKEFENPQSTLRSILVPRFGGGFRAVVNGRFRPADAEVEWLAAHEFAHTFFYRDGAPPRRVVAHSLSEERCCDAFADSFTGVERPRGLSA